MTKPDAMIVSFDDHQAVGRFMEAMKVIPDGKGITLHVGTQPLSVPVLLASSSLLAACEAALLYDQAIQNQAHKGESWVTSAELDRLYDDWIGKARAAVEMVKHRGCTTLGK